MLTPSLHDLAAARTEAAADLEQAIVALGTALRTLERATEALERDAKAEDLARGLEAAIVLHLTRAGLGGFLDRKLAGVAPSLRSLVERQHRRTPAIGGSA